MKRYVVLICCLISHIPSSQTFHRVDVMCYLIKNWAFKFLGAQVPEIFREMEASGCTADRKARQLLQNALMVLDKRH